MPSTVGIREAKARLSELVRRAAAGDTVTITERGRGVARLVPVAEPGRNLGDRLAELERRGWLTPPAPAGARRSKPMRTKTPGLALDLLAEDRDRG
jgi:prevent-host-death family protein